MRAVVAHRHAVHSCLLEVFSVLVAFVVRLLSKRCGHADGPQGGQDEVVSLHICLGMRYLNSGLWSNVRERIDGQIGSVCGGGGMVPSWTGSQPPVEKKY